MEIKDYYDIILPEDRCFMANCCAMGGLASGSGDETVATWKVLAVICISSNKKMMLLTGVWKDLQTCYSGSAREFLLPCNFVLKFSRKRKIKRHLSRDILTGNCPLSTRNKVTAPDVPKPPPVILKKLQFTCCST